jgi:hypothetical protein
VSEAQAAVLTGPAEQRHTRGISISMLWATPLRASLTITLVWRLLLAVDGVASHFLALRGSPAFSLLKVEGWPSNPLTLALSAGVQNDSVWYGAIVLHGYRQILFSNFSPLFPLLTRALSFGLHDVWISGLLLSNACLVIAIMLMHEWMKLRGQERFVPLTTVLLLVNPGAIFFGYMYTESLYLALLLGTLVAYEKGRYGVASVCAALLVLTRPTGFLVLVPLALWAFRKPTWRSAAPVLAGLAGLAADFTFLWITFGTPLAQLQQEERFGPRTLAQGLADITLQGGPGHPRSALVLLLLTGVAYLACVVLVYRYYGLEYAALALSLVAFPALTGLVSYQRYLGIAFMFPAAVAVWGHRRALVGWLTWNFWFTVAAAALFTRGVVF